MSEAFSLSELPIHLLGLEITKCGIQGLKKIKQKDIKPFTKQGFKIYQMKLNLIQQDCFQGNLLLVNKNSTHVLNVNCVQYQKYYIPYVISLIFRPTATLRNRDEETEISSSYLLA